ncbi:unnamed protein product [Spirodela intermedia]|uniref:Uncharacterized protein n=1 Tax=Spirodela intermedia TaxID=51605 RepID=A0A7I8III9_SPIIN|nr:unnamed protein product [Spirodela intermedia]CAA6657546.1 unnamed protein product [Spirodela intermedia]
MDNRSSVRTLKPPILADGFLFSGVTAVILLLFWALYSVVGPTRLPSSPHFAKPLSSHSFTPSLAFAPSSTNSNTCADLRHDPPSATFYDDPLLTYTVGRPVGNWNEKRREWMEQHPSFKPGAAWRVLVVSGSQPQPCQSPIGDHLLLRFFKNKVDYCRIHGMDIYYNTALLHPKMFTFWAKIPLVRAAMVAHPECEWIWWVDSDAIFTDMDHHLVVHGWRHLVYEKKSSTSLNAGVFLIRNSQWSMEFLDVWASLGPQSPEYDRWDIPESDDQSALIYLLLRQGDRWGDKIYLESDYYFQGYWVEIVGRLQNTSNRYLEMERRTPALRRRRAEKAEGWRAGREGWRRPFITHFTGCQPCNGKHNELYSEEECRKGMQEALNFADDQVLRHYGFAHRDLLASADVKPLSFDFPA